MISATGLVGIAAGVPYVAHRPPPDCQQAPLVVVLHLMDPPRSEAAMAAALPLAGVPAWRAYLGLPMFGARMPAGDPEAFMRLGYDDALLKLLGPVVDQAARELPSAIAALRQQSPGAVGPVGLVGGSAGAAAILLALAEGPVSVRAVALVNAAVRAADVVAAGERVFRTTYRWSDAARRVANRLDFVHRARDIASRIPQPGVLLVNGEDDAPAFPASADDLYEALSARWWSPEQVERCRIPGLGHALAEEPGLDPAPQTPGAAHVDEVVGTWLTRRLA
jgi:pimeloyl-ACP methyl ester carboxylesterase